MRVLRWGNSLAIGLPAKLIRELGLMESDHIDLIRDNGVLRVRRLLRTSEVLESLRQYRGQLPASEQLSRDDAHKRNVKGTALRPS